MAGQPFARRGTAQTKSPDSVGTPSGPGWSFRHDGQRLTRRIYLCANGMSSVDPKLSPAID